MLHQKISRARKVGETRSKLLCARGAAPLSNGFYVRFLRKGSLPAWAETRADTERGEPEVKRGSVRPRGRVEPGAAPAAFAQNILLINWFGPHLGRVHPEIGIAALLVGTLLVRAHNTFQGDMALPKKQIRLHKGLPQEVVAKIAEETLASRGVKPPEPGDKMPDGSIYAGISPDTGKPMYTRDEDQGFGTFGSGTSGFEGFAARSQYHGHNDWRVPTKAELNVLFNNRTAIGNFDLSGEDGFGSYWSATRSGKSATWGQRFSDGAQIRYPNTTQLHVRYVR